MLKVIKGNIKLYTTWLIMITLVALCVITTNLLSVAALIFFIIFMLSSDLNDSIVLLFGLLPFANIFKLQAGSTSFFTICELLLVLLAIVKSKKIKTNFAVSLLLLATYMIISSFNALNVLLIVKVLLGIYIIYLTMRNVKKEDLVHISYLLSISTIIMLLLSMNNTYFTYIEPYFIDLNYVIDSSGHISDTMRLSGFFGDPNYCSALIVISVALLCVLYYHKKIQTEFWFFLGFLIPLGFFTYSKSYFLCIFALILILIIFVLMPKHKGWAIVSIFAIMIVISMATSGKIEVLNVVLTRFSDGDITSGRSKLNNLYLSYIWQNPSILFFGEGICVDRFLGASNNVHNIYIECLFKLGIVGSLIYCCTLLYCISPARKIIGKRKFINFLPLIFFVVLFYALAGITMYELPFYMSIAFLARDFNLLGENASN